MDCRRYEELLLERSEERPQPADLARLEEHLLGCPRCRELADLLQADDEIDVPEDLADAVLARTIHGSAEPGRLAGALRLLQRDLPELARGEVDDLFTAEVMAATVIADGRRLSRRLSSLWQRISQRPRLALEGAYVTGVAVFLLVGLPGSPLAAVPRAALHQLTSEGRPAQVISVSARRVSDLGRGTWSRAERLLHEQASAISTSDLEALADSRFARSLGRTRAWLSSILSSVSDTVRAWLASWRRTPAPPERPPDLERSHQEASPDVRQPQPA